MMALLHRSLFTNAQNGKMATSVAAFAPPSLHSHWQQIRMKQNAVFYYYLKRLTPRDPNQKPKIPTRNRMSQILSVIHSSSILFFSFSKIHNSSITRSSQNNSNSYSSTQILPLSPKDRIRALLSFHLNISVIDGALQVHAREARVHNLVGGKKELIRGSVDCELNFGQFIQV